MNERRKEVVARQDGCGCGINPTLRSRVWIPFPRVQTCSLLLFQTAIEPEPGALHPHPRGAPTKRALDVDRFRWDFYCSKGRQRLPARETKGKTPRCGGCGLFEKRGVALVASSFSSTTTSPTAHQRPKQRPSGPKRHDLPHSRPSLFYLTAKWPYDGHNSQGGGGG